LSGTYTLNAAASIFLLILKSDTVTLIACDYNRTS